MSKQYPLEVNNVGEDTYELMSKGHHDLKDFAKEALRHYQWMMPLGVPQHCYLKAIPPPDGYANWYVPASKSTRGAFPATWVSETNGADDEANKFYAELTPPTNSEQGT